MTALIFIIITLFLVLKDEYDIYKKRWENQDAAKKHIEEFNKYMQKLNEIKTKDHREP